MRSHLVVSLLLVIGLSFFGGKTNVLQASLNISMLNEISIEEFQTLEDKPVHIYIDNEYKQTILKNLRLNFDNGFIKASTDTQQAIDHLFENVNTPQDAQLINKSSSLYLKPSKDGYQINLNHLEKAVNSEDFQESMTLRLNNFLIKPSYTTTQARADLALIKANEDQKIKFQLISEVGTYSSEVFSIYEFSTYYKGSLTIDNTALLETLDSFREQFEQPASNIKIVQEDGQMTIHSTGTIGQELLVEPSMEVIKNALETKQLTANLKYKLVLPNVFSENGEISDWKAISVGASDYTGSIENRVTNIKMAANYLYNNVLVMPQEQFSYNQILTTKGNFIDWKNAYIIVNGGDLKEAPGGGLCQVSTTIYRAAMNAGLPINSIKNHSLYVKYYQKHGDGLDATIYPGVKDMVFTNDLDTPILMQVYSTPNNKLVTVFYSKSETKPVNLIGPIYNKNQDLFPDVQVDRNQIKWIREFVDSGEREVFTSTYKDNLG